MKPFASLWVAAIPLCVASTVSAVSRYVNLNSSAPAAPFTSWTSAAANIQDAVDAAVDGDEIVVTNGVYSTGARSVYGYMTNRVAINKAVTVRSVNGPSQTVIAGYAVPAATNGAGAIRCAYVGANALLSGFTLTNGHTLAAGQGDASKEESGGGAWCEVSGVVSNCTFTGNSAGSSGAGAYSGILSGCALSGNSAADNGGGASGAILNNCTVSSNSAYNGGGVDSCTLTNCNLTGNSAYYSAGGAYNCTLINCVLTSNRTTYTYSAGGGADGGTLINCILSGNSTRSGGGGAFSATLSNCTLSNNSAYSGGGADSSLLNNCTLNGNSASGSGGGAEGGTLSNCILISNSAASSGGGVDQSTVNNCTFTGNSAAYGGGSDYGTLTNCTLTGNSARYGGGAIYGKLYNCIVYYNSAPSGPNWYQSTFNYCCTAPLPSGVGNISTEPLIVDSSTWTNLRLQSDSPCINSGNNAYPAGVVDLDGNPRISGGTVDMGAFEFQNPTSVISYAWLQNYGLPTDGSVDYVDTDGDGMNNWQEWVAGTDPTDPTSALWVLSATPGTSGMSLTWASVVNRNYMLQRATNFSIAPAFTVVRSNIVGKAVSTSLTDSNATGPGPFFYRVQVQR